MTQDWTRDQLFLPARTELVTLVSRLTKRLAFSGLLLEMHFCSSLPAVPLLAFRGCLSKFPCLLCGLKWVLAVSPWKSWGNSRMRSGFYSPVAVSWLLLPKPTHLPGSFCLSPFISLLCNLDSTGYLFGSLPSPLISSSYLPVPVSFMQDTDWYGSRPGAPLPTSASSSVARFPFRLKGWGTGRQRKICLKIHDKIQLALTFFSLFYSQFQSHFSC